MVYRVVAYGLGPSLSEGPFQRLEQALEVVPMEKLLAPNQKFYIEELSWEEETPLFVWENGRWNPLHKEQHSV